MTNLTDIINTIDIELKNSLSKENDIPAPLILLGSGNKSGLSQRILAKAIKQRLPEIGVPIGNLTDGSENIFEKFVDVLIDEIVKHIKEYAKITTVVDIGVNVTATGANAGGELIAIGTTTGLGIGKGILQ